MKKHFSLGKGKYYFNVKSGQSTITIFRDKKEDAENAFLNYKKVGKNVEWLGRWSGKKFHENEQPTMS